ncbi:MAG: hypothetical protein IIC89_08200, partial [Chloroflexi bacterium]|nr:hypothetical protein [Chloroflexota bacterium]
VRVGVPVPKRAVFTGLFETASTLGSLAFNFASVLALVLLVLVLTFVIASERSRAFSPLIALLAGAFFLGLFLTLVANTPEADALFGVSAALLALTVLIVAMRTSDLTPVMAIALGLMVAAYLSYEYYTLSYVFYRILDYAAIPPLSLDALRLGEALAMVAAGAAFFAWGLPRWGTVGRGGAAIVAVVLLTLTVAGLSPVSTMAILALWTTGVSLFLPFPVYLLALALFLLTIVACVRDRRAYWIAAGLLLVVLAGYMAESTYQHLLFLLGIFFLSGLVPEEDARSSYVRRSSAPSSHSEHIV